MASLSAKIELSTKGIPINWDGRNWEYYKAMMMATFGENELLEIATGTLKEDQTWDDARVAKFKCQQAKIFRLIMSSLNMNLANRFLNHKSGSDIWADLVKTYEGYADPLRKSFEIRRLVQQLQNYVCKHGEMETHITAMFRIRDRLALLQHNVQSEDMIAALLKAMPKTQEYGELKRSIRIGASAQNYTPEGVRDMILLAEAEMLEEDIWQQKGSVNQCDDGNSKKSAKQQKRQKPLLSGPKHGTCYRCGEPGHIARFCPNPLPANVAIASAGNMQQRKGNMKTAGTATKKRSGACISTRSRKRLQIQTQKGDNGQIKDHLEQVSANPVEPDEGKAETAALACDIEKDIDVNRMKSQEVDDTMGRAGRAEGADVTSIDNVQRPHEWHLDTGCNIHIVGSKDYFSTYRDFSKEEQCEGSLSGFAKHANVMAKGTGRITLTTRCGRQNETGNYTEFFLDDVMFVPHATSNLLSPGLAIRQGFEMEFDKSRNALQLWKDGELCVEAAYDEEDDTWPFSAYNKFLENDGGTQHKSRVIKYTRADGVADLKTWHARLGHTCPQYLKIMVDQEMAEGMHLKRREKISCDTCQLAKQRRKTHAKEIPHHIKHPNEVVYADLLSPGRHSKGSVSQMLVIMDGYSRFLSIYLLKSKADTNARMMDYVKWAERQAEPYKVKRVVTDKGTEFENKDIERWYALQGIAHQIVGPRAQQQNPIERANQSILKMIKVQLKHSGFPLTLWTDAATNAVYIKNRVFTKGANGITPWEKFYNKRPDLHHIRTFGAIAYAHVPRSERSNKLDDNCIVGYLLGYEEGAAGCKIYCPKNRTRKVVSDIRVNENILFKDRHEPEAQSEFERWFTSDTSIDEEENYDIDSSDESEIEDDAESAVSEGCRRMDRSEDRMSSVFNKRCSAMEIDSSIGKDTTDDHNVPMCVIREGSSAYGDACEETIELATKVVDAESAAVTDGNNGSEIIIENGENAEIECHGRNEDVDSKVHVYVPVREHENECNVTEFEECEPHEEQSEQHYYTVDQGASTSPLVHTAHDQVVSEQEIDDELPSFDDDISMEPPQFDNDYESEYVVYNDSGDDGDDHLSDDCDMNARLEGETQESELILPESSTTIAIKRRMHTDQHGSMPAQMIGSRRKLPIEYEKDEYSRSKRNTKLPKKYDDFLIYSALSRKGEHAERLRPQDIRLPRNYREAIRSPQAAKWKLAMNEEMNALRAKQVLEQIDQIPEGKHAISTRWVMTVKTDEQGYIVRYKARLVARGFRQIVGVDFQETFSPVARTSSFRLLLALAAHFNLGLWQADVNTAYLNADLHDVQYLQEIEGYPGPHAYVVRKALYGLRQSGREWNSEFNKWFVENEFKRCKTEPCLYVCEKDGILALVLVYVDDLICATNSEAFKTKLFKKPDQKYGIKDLGRLHQYVGIQVEQNEGSITIHQEQYTKKILERFGFDSCSNPTQIPMETTAKYTSNPKPRVGNVSAKFGYKEAIGALMYLVTCTRPDLAYAVGQLSRFVENPSEQHVGGVKKILRYLIGTKRKGITYRDDKKIDLGIHVQGYADSDWAGDLESRKSTTGYIFTLSGGAISWASRLQTITAQSTAEAEYVAACEACMEGKALLNLLREIKPNQQCELTIGVDNQSSYIMATDPTFSRKTRHIEMKWHYVREQVESGQVRLWKVKSAENPADLFTKPLQKAKLIKFTAIIGMNIPETK
ncbi:Integrase catalytic core protein, partial [Globisporangium splendens]